MPRYSRTYSKDLEAAVHVRLTATAAEQLAAIAEREGHTRPAIIRAAVAQYLAGQSATRSLEVAQ